jgi:branched-chain amino acid transport system ATP-binding protein
MRTNYWPLLVAAATLMLLPFILDPIGLPLR